MTRKSRRLSRRSSSNRLPSMYDEHVSTSVGRAGLRAAHAAGDAQALIERAFASSRLTSRDVAAALSISEGRVSQLKNGDGNVRISTLARLLSALGFRLELTMRRVSGEGADKRHESAGSADYAWVQLFVDGDGVYEHEYTPPNGMDSCTPLGAPVRHSRTSASSWKKLAQERRAVEAGVRQ